MKRAFAIILALALMLSLSVTAFAENESVNNTGSITITNATIGETYKAYQIFDATYGVDDSGDTDGVSYTISKTILDENGQEIPNPIFVYMFGADGEAENDYFSYNKDLGIVKRKDDTVTKEDISKYLTKMIREDGIHNGSVDITATNKKVEFTSLPYGYYVIDKVVPNMTAEELAKIVVTIDSSTPHADVIDKNQKPATEFSKLVYNETTGQWESSNSAQLGDNVEFQVQFDATNYDGEHQVKYYSIKDTKGNSLWVEFEDIVVTVGDRTLEKGYYHCANPAIVTGEWKFLGKDDNGDSVWTAEEMTQENPEDLADWYLIHYGFDEFDIVIPWLEDHNFTGNTSGFSLTFSEDADSKYNSVEDVVISYYASVEPSANLGENPENPNLWNRAKLSWLSDTTKGPGDPSITTTKVYAMGVDKTDADSGKYLEGAEFELYSDADHKNPVFVIPTNLKGVYIVDDLHNEVTGVNKETSRKKYEAYLKDYLGEDYATTQKNVVTTEVNGKLVVLGLAAGKYYLVETDAPDGYNELPTHVEVEIGKKEDNFFVVANPTTGEVLDEEQAPEGFAKYNYTVTKVDVTNSKGVELPSTGGNGTMMLITFGTLIALGFAILMITQKKMSAYRD